MQLSKMLIVGLLVSGVLLYGCLAQQATPAPGEISTAANTADTDIGTLQTDLGGFNGDLATLNDTGFDGQTLG